MRHNSHCMHSGFTVPCNRQTTEHTSANDKKVS